MNISRSLKESISDMPEKVSNAAIEFTKIEKWTVSKASLLEQKKTIEDSIAEYQAQLDEIDQLLYMLKD